VNISKTIVMTVLVASLSFAVNADSDRGEGEHDMSSHSMPEGAMNGMPMMKMMQKKQAMMQNHMTTMETHLANIEALLKQLVELQQR